MAILHFIMGLNFHHHHWSRPSATLSQLTRLSSNCKRQFSLCRKISRLCVLLVTVACQETNYLVSKLNLVPQRLNNSDNSLDAATRELLSTVHVAPSIKHERLKEVHASIPNEQTETSFSKMEHTDLARFRSCHHPVV